MIARRNPRSIIFTERPASAGRWRRAAGRALGSILVALVLVPGLVRPYLRFAPDGHMRMSFNQAVSSVFCRSLRLSDRFDIPAVLSARPDQLYVPIEAVIDSLAGSVDGYCRSLTLPVVNNENSLMLAMQGIVLVDRGISTAGIGRTLALVRLTIVAMLSFALFSSGVSFLTGLVVTVMACCVLRMLAPYQYGPARSSSRCHCWRWPFTCCC